MPEMDGYQATARLRSQPRFATLPIVAMTAHATIEERQRCVAAGMNDHVSKPIDPAALYDVLRPLRDDRPAARRVPRRRPRRRPRRGAAAVDGLDTAQGLRRVAGNRTLYLRLLRQFVDGPGGRRGADPARASSGATGRWPSAWPTPSRGRRGTWRRARSRRRPARWRRRSATVSSAARVESLRARARRGAGAPVLGAAAAARRRRIARRGARGPPRPRRSTRPRSRRSSERWSRLLAECDAGTHRRPRAGGPRAARPLRRRGGLRPLRQAGHRLRLRGRARGVAPGRRREGTLGVRHARRQGAVRVPRADRGRRQGQRGHAGRGPARRLQAERGPGRGSGPARGGEERARTCCCSTS